MSLPDAVSRLDDRSPRGVAGVFARLIADGDLAPGERLPTVREVAAGLGVSPATVSEAWQALQRAGLVVARGRAGTFVHETPRAWLSPRLRGLRGDAVTDDVRLDLSRGTPDPDLLPDLAPALGRVAIRAGTGSYQDEPVLPGLDDALRALWPASPEALTVVDGGQDGVERTLAELVSYGDRVVLESPGYPPFLDLVESLGGRIVPVELDAEGVRVDSLREALATRPVAVVLQPRAQNPTGVCLSPERAERLARLLRRREHAGVLVVEDDHSALLSIAPEVTLAALLPGRVVHVRSLSKSHGPDLRVAGLSGPTALVDRLVARRMLGPGWTSRMVQTIVLDLLTSPSSRDQVVAARTAYAARQEQLVAALGTHGLRLARPDGINLWLPVADEQAAQLDLAAAGLRVAAGSTFLAPGHAPGAFVRVTAGRVPESEADGVAAALAHAAGA